jgi:uncharacterized Zn finger protein
MAANMAVRTGIETPRATGSEDSFLPPSEEDEEEEAAGEELEVDEEEVEFTDVEAEFDEVEVEVAEVEAMEELLDDELLLERVGQVSRRQDGFETTQRT